MQIIDSGSFINIARDLLITLYIYCKAINYTLSAKQKRLSIITCLLCAFLYVIRPHWIPELMVRPILCVVFIVYIWKVYTINIDTAISAYLLSFGINYFFWGIASLLISFAFAPFVSNGHTDALIDLNEPIFILIYIMIAALQFFLAYLLFRIRRFKNGFSFLLKKHAVILALMVSGFVLVFISWLSTHHESYENSRYMILIVIAGIIIAGVGIIIWVRRGIKSFYRKKMKDHSIELLEQELAEKEREIQRLTEQNDVIRVANHKTTHRLAALERSVIGLAKKMQDSNHSMEMSEELAITLEDVKSLSRDYQEGINQIKGKKPLPSTKIKMLDDLFEYFSEQCAESGIDFNLKINGSIPFMAEHVIPQNKLGTMIGDHLQDALIAVNASDYPFRNILVVLGLVGDFYELAIFDSGIPFEVDTLVLLGTKRVTTHADTGGSGIGFMTTFDTMREYGASLVISEAKSTGADYSKSVTIRFDGKNQYIIETYRPDVFPNQGDRLTIKGLFNSLSLN